jgi:hypothetical protein
MLKRRNASYSREAKNRRDNNNSGNDRDRGDVNNIRSKNPARAETPTTA